MKRARWVFGAAVVAGVVTLVAPAVGQGKAAAGSPPPGSLDRSFGSGGIVTYSPSADHPATRGIAVQPDGKIVVVGGSSLARYLPSGAPDPTFGDGGYVAAGGFLSAVAFQKDGKIVVAGARGRGSESSEIMVARYNANGSPDASFGTNGITTTPGHFYYGASADAVAVLPNGSIVAAGSDYGDPFSEGTSFILARYTPAGAPDQSFGHHGVVETWFSGIDELAGIAVLPSGKIVASGTGFGDGHGDDNTYMVLARYLSSGSLDTTFGTHGTGKVISPWELQYEGGPPALQRGKIIVAGSVLARFTANGRFDPTFGTNGVVKIAGGAIVVRADGKILIAAAGNRIVGFLPDGRVDKSFGSGGVVHLGGGVSSLALQADGKILVGGTTTHAWTLTRLVGQAKSAWLRWSQSSEGPSIPSAVLRATRGGAAVSKEFRLSNSTPTGSGRLTITLAGSSAFSITSDKCTGRNIGEKQSCWVRVTYAPRTAGANNYTSLIASDPVGAFASLSLAGCSAGPSPHIYWGDVSADGGAVNAVSRTGGCVTTFASGLHVKGLRSLAVDRTHVYWVDRDHGTVNEAPLSGGPVTTLASGQKGPWDVAVNGTHVYWVDYYGGTVNEVPVGGGNVTTLATGQAGPGAVAVNGAHVYWVNSRGGTVEEVPVGGGRVTTLASGDYYPNAVAVDGKNVFWTTDSGKVKKVSVGGGTVTTLATDDGPTSVAVYGSHVYWADYWGDSIKEVPVGGGKVTILASSQPGPLALAVDSAYVYWGNLLNGTVRKVPRGGGEVVTIARNQVDPFSLAVGP